MAGEVGGTGVAVGLSRTVALSGVGVAVGTWVSAGSGVGGAMTVVVPVTMLLPVSGSTPAIATLALSVMVPAVEGSIKTWMVTVTLSPLVKSPRWHWTMLPDLLQLPWVGVAETKLIPADSASVRMIPTASEGPSLVTMRL